MKLEIDIPYYVFEQVKRENTIKNVLNKIDFAIRNGVERPHGEWKTEPHSRIIHCSNCDAIENLNRLYVSNFCYSCGADMRKEEGEHNDGE